MASALPIRLIAALVVITGSALPISRIFQWWSPTSTLFMVGGMSTLFSLPLTVKLIAGSTSTAPSSLLYLAMFFSPFMFASSIDLVISLENDGFISDYMSLYLKRGEPYLATAYSTALCYWDGIAHFLLYWAMLYGFFHRNGYFRSLSLYWFGTFYTSMIVLIVGSIAGPFGVYSTILLNTPYLILPIVYIIWVISTATYHKIQTVSLSSGSFGVGLRVIFFLFFICSIVMSIARGLVAFGANREVLNYYGSEIEQPIKHAHKYPAVTVVLFFFYGVPFYVYAIYCLVMNYKPPALVDLSVLYAGVTANAQVGYLGPYLVSSGEGLKFSDWMSWFVFWVTNLLIVVVPHIFALYCYNSYPGEINKNQPTKMKTRSSARLKMRKLD